MSDIPIKVPKSFKIIAHRGASAYAPENTLAAFLLAEKMGINDIELDIQQTKDRHLVIVHDELLDRYGYPGVRVSNLTMSEIDNLDMGSWFSPFLFRGEHVLTLEALFILFGIRMNYVIEIKSCTPDIPMDVLSCVKQNKLSDFVTITSFHFDMLKEVKKIAPQQRVGWIVKEGLFNTLNIQQAREACFEQICPNAVDVNILLVTEAHKQNMNVRAYGVKSKEDIYRTINTHCDGLTINWPDWVIH